MNSFAPKNLLPSKFELDVGVAAAWDGNDRKRASQIRKNERKGADGEAGRGSAPPLSRTARLCPLFSSTSSLYIPELLAGGSGRPLEEEEEEEAAAPTTCEERCMDGSPPQN